MEPKERTPGIDYRNLLDQAEAWAETAGEMLRTAQDDRRTIDFKGKINLVTEMDRRVERYLGSQVQQTHPAHDLLAEEEERNVDTGADFRWIIDPLDGTTNYAHGLPIYSVSIACEHRGHIVAGVVYQPVLGEMFSATLGGGARLNGETITVTSEDQLERALLVTGFPYDMHDSDRDNLDHFRAFMKTARAVRRLGSAALDLCYVACGRFDGFWEMKLFPWDLAAGSLIASEAGGRLTSLDGGEFSVFDGSVIASNGHIHGAMLDVLQNAGTRPT